MIASDNYIRKDMLLFNSLMVFILGVTAVVLLYAPVMGSFNLFVPLAAMLFTMIFSYTLGLQRGLMVAIVVTFLFGSYIIYESMVAHRMREVNFAYIAWLFFFPLSSIMAGQLSRTIAGYKREIETKKQLEQLVTIDASTGLYNSQGFFRKLDEEFVRARRYKNTFSILLVKISNFDELQMIYGELDSLKILQAVAERVEAQTRFSDIKALLASDMLSVVLTETDEDGARVVIEKLHQALDRVTTDIKGTKKVIRIKPSIGISSIRQTDADVLEAFERAKEELNYDRG